MRPVRVHNFGIYFITAATWERRTLFTSEAWARLFLKTKDQEVKPVCCVDWNQ